MDGSQQRAELRIIGSDGTENHAKEINANEGHVVALEPGNGWGGIDFKEKVRSAYRQVPASKCT